MDPPVHAGARIAIVTLLHALLAWYARAWWIFGPRYGHDLLAEGTAAAICFVLLVPVWARGNPRQRAAAFFLVLLPAILFGIVFYHLVQFCVYIYGPIPPR